MTGAKVNWLCAKPHLEMLFSSNHKWVVSSKLASFMNIQFHYVVLSLPEVCYLRLGQAILNLCMNFSLPDLHSSWPQADAIFVFSLDFPLLLILFCLAFSFLQLSWPLLVKISSSQCKNVHIALWPFYFQKIPSKPCKCANSWGKLHFYT